MINKELELQTELATNLFHSIKCNQPWDTATLTARCLYARSEFELKFSKNGELVHRDFTPDDVSRLIHPLRDAMARESGAWFSMNLNMRADGSYEFEFNYDNKPDWNIDPSPETYLDDLEKFPRPSDQIPAWHPAFGRDLASTFDPTPLEYEVAMMLYNTALQTQGWDKTQLTVTGFNSETPSAVAQCDSGLTMLAEYQIPITAESPIVTLHHTMTANGRPWDSMTLWLEADDGTFITTYQ